MRFNCSWIILALLITLLAENATGIPNPTILVETPLHIALPSLLQLEEPLMLVDMETLMDMEPHMEQTFANKKLKMPLPSIVNLPLSSLPRPQLPVGNHPLDCPLRPKRNTLQQKYAPLVPLILAIFTMTSALKSSYLTGN